VVNSYTQYNQIEIVDSHTIPRSEWEGWRRPISQQRGAGLLAWVAATKKAYAPQGVEYFGHPAYQNNNNHYRHLKSKTCHTMLLVPLLDLENNCIGVIRLINKEGPDSINYYDQEDLEVAEIVANLTALTLLYWIIWWRTLLTLPRLAARLKLPISLPTKGSVFQSQITELASLLKIRI